MHAPCDPTANPLPQPQLDYKPQRFHRDLFTVVCISIDRRLTASPCLRAFGSSRARYRAPCLRASGSSRARYRATCLCALAAHVPDIVPLACARCQLTYPYWNSDTAGFNSGHWHTMGELIVRWFQFSIFTSVVRMHGSRTPKEPAQVPLGPQCDPTGAAGGPIEPWVSVRSSTCNSYLQ